MHTSSSYAKILGETNFHTREFCRRGSKAKDGGGKKEKKERRAKVGNNNGQLRIATPPQVAHAKPPGPKTYHIEFYISEHLDTALYEI